MHLEQIINKITKSCKTQLPLLRVQGQNWYCAWSLHTAPPTGWANHQVPSAWPLDLPLVSPHLRAYVALTNISGSSKGNCYFFSFPPAATGVPIKPCLNLLSGLINFYWLKNPRSLVVNISTITKKTELWQQLEWAGSEFFTTASDPRIDKPTPQCWPHETNSRETSQAQPNVSPPELWDTT